MFEFEPRWAELSVHQLYYSETDYQYLKRKGKILL